MTTDNCTKAFNAVSTLPFGAAIELPAEWFGGTTARQAYYNALVSNGQAEYAVNPANGQRELFKL